MNSKETKAALRASMTEKRNAISLDEKTKLDRTLCEKIAAVIEERKAKIIHSYLPFRDEPDIFPLLRSLLESNHTIVCPKSLPGRQLQNLVLRSLDELEEGKFGTKHPANSVEHNGPIDLFLVPGLAFDKQHYRLGYGAGYYDRFFSEHPNGYKVGVCYPFQIVDSLPVESFDVPLNTVIY